MSVLEIVPGVPREITRADYTALVEASGFSAKHLMSLEFRASGIIATAFALDAEGNRIIDGEDAATHRVFVKVVD